jgi:predicted secreted protein
VAELNSSYPGRDLGLQPGLWDGNPLVDTGGLTGRPFQLSGITDGHDPSLLSTAVLNMIPYWRPIQFCTGGTKLIRRMAEEIIPREPREDLDAYNRRIFHATMPPFLQRLASQAAGTILRKGVELKGDPYWQEWAKDVTGDGMSLNEFARQRLNQAILYGHSSVMVDYPSADAPASLAAERENKALAPYLIPVECSQILGWRTEGNRASTELTQVRIRERLIEPVGDFGEKVFDQVRVMEPGKYQIWRNVPSTQALPGGTPGGWQLFEEGTTSVDDIPLVTVYGNRLGTLVSRPPLLEVAYLCLAYCQRFTDYHNSIHVGASPILVLRGFDPDNDSPLGLSVNTAIVLPPEGGAEYVQPTSAAFDAQLQCLQTLEEQISRLGINTLTQQNLTNIAASSKRLDRTDQDSMMAVLAADLTGALQEVLEIAADYAGVECPEVIIRQDYENRLVDGNQITAFLQLFMQGAISQETLLEILQQGEVLPPGLDIDEEITRTRDMLEEQAAREALAYDAEQGSGLEGGNVGQGEDINSQTLPTPMRPGKNAE